jgi:hypothetical protein
MVAMAENQEPDEDPEVVQKLRANGVSLDFTPVPSKSFPREGNDVVSLEAIQTALPVSWAGGEDAAVASDSPLRSRRRLR